MSTQKPTFSLATFIHTVFSKYGVLLVLVCAVAASSWSLLIPGLGTGHDLNHQARIFEMTTALREGIFPVIWSQNLAYGYGMPLFEFYAPLPYYIGAAFYFVVGDLTLAVKLMIFALNIFTIAMAFRLGKALFTEAMPAVLVAVAVAVAPYRAVDIYVRAALSEAWAIAFILMVLVGIVEIARARKNAWIFVTLGMAGLLLSHNLTAILSVPFIAAFGIVYVLVQKKAALSSVKVYLQQAFSGLLGVGLAAFYALPVIFEKGFTQVDLYTLSQYYDFRQHFLYIRQLLEPWGEWEFGGSGWGPFDEMSFFLGFGQLFIIGVAILVVSAKMFSKKRGQLFGDVFLLHVSLLGLSFGVLLLTLLKMQWLWELVSFAKYVQFPWRLLALALVFLALLAGSTVLTLPQKMRKPFVILSVLILLTANARYFRSEKYHDHSEKYAQMQEVIRTENSSNLFDYIPANVDFFEKRGFYLYKKPDVSGLDAPAKSILLTQSTEGIRGTVLSDKTTKKELQFQADKGTEVQLALAAYPGWEVMIDGITAESTSGSHGLLTFPLPAGEHRVTVVLQDTPVRKWAKIISILSLGTVLLIVIAQRKVKKLHS